MRWFVVLCIVSTLVTGCQWLASTPPSTQSSSPRSAQGAESSQPSPSPTPLSPTASATATSTPTPAPRPTYVVQQGDTLGVIATGLGVSVEALAEANAITDVNLIEVGQVLFLPGDGPLTMPAVGAEGETPEAGASEAGAPEAGAPEAGASEAGDAATPEATPTPEGTFWIPVWPTEPVGTTAPTGSAPTGGA